MKNHIKKYLDSYAERGPWKLEASSIQGIRNAVVIPALAEYPTILDTIHSLSLNSPHELRRTLIICVVNNRPFPNATEEDLLNNRKTISILRSLIQKEACSDVGSREADLIDVINRSEIRLGLVDASSRGLELPVEGGVGLARKIGMDLSLAVMDDGLTVRNLLLSLDADTLVESSYLHEVESHFQRKKVLGAVVSFAHRTNPDASLQEAIAYYESFLRHYQIGLRYARSPYAFHTIGSTIISSAEGYAMVRGMPKRLAGEDFYFLNKLNKISPVSMIHGTTVFPSSRISQRTPFGTGNKVDHLLQEEKDKNLFYDPCTFSVLKHWLASIEDQLHLEGKDIFSTAEKIDPLLKPFLQQIHFIDAWDLLKTNFPSKKNLLWQFHAWFDGLKTLKLIHYLTEKKYPKISLPEAVERTNTIIQPKFPDLNLNRGPSTADVLTYLRELEKMMQKTWLTDITA